MPIIAHFDGDVQTYLSMERWRPPAPEACPLCRERAGFVCHGSYLRYVAESLPCLQIAIPRLKCKACRCTFGVLPDFLVPGRHYSARLIELVLALRYQLNASRRALANRFQGIPALSTCFAWISAFAAGADRWLHAVLRALTRFDVGHDPLQWLVSPIGQAHGPPRLLLDLLPQLLVALGVTEPDRPVDMGKGLGWLLRWGQWQHLPRLL